MRHETKALDFVSIIVYINVRLVKLYSYSMRAGVEIVVAGVEIVGAGAELGVKIVGAGESRLLLVGGQLFLVQISPSAGNHLPVPSPSLFLLISPRLIHNINAILHQPLLQLNSLKLSPSI